MITSWEHYWIKQINTWLDCWCAHWFLWLLSEEGGRCFPPELLSVSHWEWEVSSLLGVNRFLWAEFLLYWDFLQGGWTKDTGCGGISSYQYSLLLQCLWAKEWLSEQKAFWVWLIILAGFHLLVLFNWLHHFYFKKGISGPQE